MITVSTRILEKIDALEIGDTMDKKEFITKEYGYYDFFVMRCFDVHFCSAKKRTDKKFVTKNSIITRIS